MNGNNTGKDHEEAMLLDCTEEVTIARAQSQMYDFLATFFNMRPDLELVRMLRGYGAEYIKELVNDSNLPDDISSGWVEMNNFIELSLAKSNNDIQQELAIDWTRLFRGVSPYYGPIPPYEACFLTRGGTELAVIQTVNEIYRSHGFSINTDCNERPDYIGLEFSYLAHLLNAEAQAWEQGDADSAMSYQYEANLFLSEHTGAWVGQFVEQAMDQAATGFYRGLLKLCQGVILSK